MATKDETQVLPTQEIQPEVGKSELTEKTASELRMEKLAALPDPTGLDGELSDADKVLEKKAEPALGSDFYQRFLDKQEQAEFAEDMQSADTYWNNRPEERKVYEDQYGDKAREAFDANYAKVEDVWRKKLDNETDKVIMNGRYDWLFGKGENISYDNAPVFEAVHEIYNGARRLDTMLTDKTMSDMEAAVGSKNYMNDQGKIVELKDNEKWYSWSKGTGTEMNSDDPKHRSLDGRKITGFEYVPFDPEMRQPAYIKAIYEGDFAKGQIVSMWDTTNSWLMKSNGKTAGSFLNMIPHTAARTVVNITADMITGATSLLGSFANWMDADDSGNAFIDAMNNTATAVKARKMSTSEYDQSKTVTLSNGLDFVAQVASQLYVGAGLYKGVNALTKVFLAKNPLLVEAAKLTAGGKTFEAGLRISQFEQKYGLASRSASLVGLTLATGDSVVSEARAAGFNEDEVSSIYIAYFGAMLGANTISNRMLEPYFTNASAAPIMKDVIKKSVTEFAGVAEDKAKIGIARRMVQKMTDAVTKLAALGAKAGHAEQAAMSPFLLNAKGIMYRGFNEVLEEEAEFVGQEAVELGATLIAQHKYKGEQDIPKFDTLLEEGYLVRQLPNIIMSGLGGFMGGAMTHFLPGFQHNNPQSEIIKGRDADRMLRIAINGGQNEVMFLKQLEKQKKAGMTGSKLLSVKMNDKTGKFYKMTDPEAAGSISQAEAGYRAIMNQYLMYKTMYGSGAQSFDEIMKADSTLKAELDNSLGHVLSASLTKLHKDKLSIIQGFNPDSKVPMPDSPKPKKAEVKDDPTAPEDISTSTGIVKEAPVNDAEILKTYNKELAKQVEERAGVFGTTNYKEVKRLIEIENKIDDILSGNAAAQQVVRALVRTNKIGAFLPEYQKDMFGDTMNAKGEIEPSEFTKLEEGLLETVFAADSNFAVGHALRHAKYVEESTEVTKIVNSNFGEKELQSLADSANRKPKSIALDTDTTNITALTNGVNKLLQKLISGKEYEGLVATTRESLGLTQTTEKYVVLIEDKATQALENEELTELSVDEIKNFVSNNFDLIYKASLSVFIDRLATNPTEFIVGKIDLSKGKFKDELIENLMRLDNLSIGVNENTANAMAEAEAEVVAKSTILDGLEKSLEALNAKIPATSAERTAQMKESQKLRSEISVVRAELARARAKATIEGTFDTILPSVGANTLIKMRNEATSSELTSLVKVETEAITQSKAIITNLKTIMNNIAPVVPTVPKLGAVYNLLNEITIDGNTLGTTIRKIVSEEDEPETYSVDPETGLTRRVETTPTILQQLNDSILYTGLNTSPYSKDKDYVAGKSVMEGEFVYTAQGPVPAGTPLDNTQYWKLAEGEFRNLEEAKHVLNSIKVRLGQVQVLSAVMNKLSMLQKYSREHIPLGNNRYDQIPRFMAEYIFDSERADFLMKKAVRTVQEEEDIYEMLNRRDLITNFERPDSVHARLLVAKEKAERLVDLGIKSLSLNERFRVYKNEVPRNLNAIKSSLNKYKFINGLTPEIDAAIAEFNAITETFVESDSDALIKGKVALDKILGLIYTIPGAKRTELYQVLGSYATPSAVENYIKNFMIDALATSHDQFVYYYNSTLTELEAKGGLMAPTIPQENMVKTVFSFVTDETNTFQQLTSNQNKVSFFVDGGNGVGKSTMVGLALAAAQKYLNKKVADKKGDAKGFNKILFASLTEARAKHLRDLSIKTGVDPSSDKALTKRELYKFLDDPKANTDEFSVIAFDEATFIQGEANEGQAESELRWFTRKIEELNKTRGTKDLPPIKLLLIGDQWQGGWQVGMSTMFNSAKSDTIVDYDKLGERRIPVSMAPDNVMTGTRLTYAFRTLCSKVSEIAESIRNIRNDRVGSMFGAKITTKLVMSSGTISNDKERSRIGGVKVITDQSKLYDDPELIANISNQLKVHKDTKFKVLIVDDSLTDKKTPSADLNALIEEFPNNFEFCTIIEAQGGEADYVIANTTAIFPKLPTQKDGDLYKIDRLSMVISRARLFAKVTADPEVNIENVDNAVIKMLSEKDADALTKEWNDFYLKTYRSLAPTAAPEAAKAEAATEVKTEKEEVEQEIVIDNSPVVPILNTVIPEDTSIEIRNEPVDLVVTQVQKASSIISKETADAIRKEGEATLSKDSTDDEAYNKKLRDSVTAIIERSEGSVTELIDLVGTEVEGLDVTTTDKEETLAVAVDQKTKKPNKKSIAKKEAMDLEALGFLYAYSKIKQEASIDEQLQHRLYYANDIFGYDTHKGKDGAKEEIAEAIKAFREMEAGDSSIADQYEFSLVSVLIRESKVATDPEVVVHQIYAKKVNSNTKSLIVSFPSGSIDENGPAGMFFKQRAKVVTDAHGILKALAGHPNTKGRFASDKNRIEVFGKAGVPLSNKSIERINKAYGNLFGDKESFPSNTSNTKFGRTAISDQYDDPNGYVDKKLSAETLRDGSGQIFMETKISKSDFTSVFQAVTPGAPMRSSDASKAKYSAVKTEESERAYISSLPVGDVLEKNKSILKAVDDAQIKVGVDKKLTSAVVERLTDAGTVFEEVDGKAITRFGKYTIITVKGMNGRKISLYSDSKAPFKLLFGFGADNKPIRLTTKLQEELDADLEVKAIIDRLGNNNIDDSMEVNKVTAVAEINKLLGKHYNYDAEKVEKIANADDKLAYMSKIFSAGRIISFADLQIPLADFKTIMKGDGVQVSDALTFTKTTKDNKQGKSFVIYTYNSKYNLNDVDTLNKILTRFGAYKAADFGTKKFNARLFAKHGIGIIMLDNKMQTIEGLLDRLRAKQFKDINRSSSPVGSATNKRMVVFVKELTQAVYKVSKKSLLAHNNLPKMGVGPGFDKIFSESSMTSLETMLVEMMNTEPARFQALQQLLGSITADASLGYQVVDASSEPDLVQGLLEIKETIPRKDYFDEYLTPDKIADMPDVQASLDKFGITETNIFGKATGPQGKVQAGLIYDKTTGRPAVVNGVRNAITFIDPAYHPKAEAVFNMAYFVEIIDKVGAQLAPAGEGNKLANELAKTIDTIMQNYTEPNTLRKGVMWTGRLSTSLNNSRIAKVHSDDAGDMFTTSIKEINPPSVIVSIKALVEATKEKEVKPVVTIEAGDERTHDEIVASFIGAARNLMHDTIENFPSIVSEKDITAARDILMRHIADTFLTKNHFVNPKEDTTMILEEFDKLVAPLRPKPDDVRKQAELEEVRKNTTDFVGQTPAEVAAEVARDTANIVANNVEGNKYRAAEILQEQIDNNPILAQDESKKQSLKDQLIDQMNKMEKEVRTIPAGELLLTKVTEYADKLKEGGLTSQELNTLRNVSIGIDNGRLPLTAEQLANMPALVTLLTDIDSYTQLSPEEQADILKKGSELQLAIKIGAEESLKLVDEALVNLDKAFRKLIKKC